MRSLPAGWSKSKRHSRYSLFSQMPEKHQRKYGSWTIAGSSTSRQSDSDKRDYRKSRRSHVALCVDVVCCCCCRTQAHAHARGAQVTRTCERPPQGVNSNQEVRGGFSL